MGFEPSTLYQYDLRRTLYHSAVQSIYFFFIIFPFLFLARFLFPSGAMIHLNKLQQKLAFKISKIVLNHFSQNILEQRERPERERGSKSIPRIQKDVSRYTFLKKKKIFENALCCCWCTLYLISTVHATQHIACSMTIATLTCTTRYNKTDETLIEICNRRYMERNRGGDIYSKKKRDRGKEAKTSWNRKYGEK